MKERPILFSGPMVRAILEGRKTVTRRAMKNQPCRQPVLVPNGGANFWSNPLYIQGAMMGSQNHSCPYGQPGDRLWVREAWAEINVAQAPSESWVVYRECDNRTDYGGPWKPSIHMRRRDSRILLEITDVRVERLQDISEQQALAEGIVPHPRGGWHWHPHDVHDMDDWHQFGFTTAYWAFHDLWVGINGRENWDANPWVWAVEFKRVQP